MPEPAETTMAAEDRRGRALAVAAAVVLAAWIGAPTPAVAGHDPAGPGEVSAAEDDPPECRTATTESDDGCGARGRDHFANPGHTPPVEACADRRTPAGARITRILPDGPRRPDGSPAFVTGACVYLPPGYDTSGLAYPVIYLLHGGGGDQADWLTFGGVDGILDRWIGADPDRAVIAVMPDGRSGQWYDYEDGSFLNETYVLDHLIPYVDAHFRTIADRTGRAIAGLSNGGYGAVHLAAKRPDLFVAAGGMSSNLGARTMAGLGPANEVHYQGSVPYQLASNLDGVDVILDLGTSCQSDLTTDACASIVIDLLFWPDHLAFTGRMSEVGHRGELDYRETEGAHAWRWWSRWLEERDLPFFAERLAAPRPASVPGPVSPVPATFRYRTIAPAFAVWGYEVAVDRDVREFLDLRDVTADGFEIQGSGRAVVRTAPRYRPGGRYRVSGTGAEPTTLTADPDGRLTIAVDLGPSHTADQFTEQADLAEAAGGYWVVRRVGIEPAAAGPPSRPGGPPAPAPAGPPGATDRTGPPSRPAEAPGRGGHRPAGPTGGAAGSPVRPPDPAPVGDNPPVAAAPVAARREADPYEPQLIPTVVFILMVAAGPVLWWHRRRRTAADPAPT